MGTVASELKSEREKRKISLAHVAAETRISLRHLESLEEGRFSDLPGGMYNRAILRAYCEALTLSNMQDIMQRYEDELSPASEKPLKSRAHPQQKSHAFRIGPLALWGLMLLISAAGIFFSRKWITAVFSPYFSHSPAAPVRYEGVKPPAASPAPVTPPPATNEPPAQVAAPEPATTDSIVPSAQESAIPPPPAAKDIPKPNSDANKAVPTPATPTAAQPLRLEINATETCWVSVDRDGSPAFRKTMEPGEVQSLSAAERFQIILGNAAGVHLKINGKPAKQLGKPGAVVKVLIDVKNLQEFLDQSTG